MQSYKRQCNHFDLPNRPLWSDIWLVNIIYVFKQKILFYLAMRDPVRCNVQMMRNLLIIYEALFNKPNYKRAQTANSIKFINVLFISLYAGAQKVVICIARRIAFWGNPVVWWTKHSINIMKMWKKSYMYIYVVGIFQFYQLATWYEPTNKCGRNFITHCTQRRDVAAQLGLRHSIF